jgi:hypothetical protein
MTDLTNINPEIFKATFKPIYKSLNYNFFDIGKAL